MFILHDGGDREDCASLGLKNCGSFMSSTLHCEYPTDSIVRPCTSYAGKNESNKYTSLHETFLI